MSHSTTKSDTFVPLEWISHFGRLSAKESRAAAARVCAEAVRQATVDSPLIQRAIAAVAEGAADAELNSQLQTTLQQVEESYDRLVGDDEGKLLHRDPTIKDLFTKARALTAVQFALQGQLHQMAYEASFVLDDLDYVRRLVGM